MQKTLIVMLAVIITSLFVKGIIQVGDTTINQNVNQNYNGYFTLEDENLIISKFAGHYVYQKNFGQYGYRINLGTSGYNLYGKTYDVLMLQNEYLIAREVSDGYLGRYSGYRKSGTNFVFISSGNLTDTVLNVPNYYLYIYAMSNYEVQP